MLNLVLSGEEIKSLVRNISSQIYRTFEHPLVIVSILDGAFMFTADLVRELSPTKILFCKMKSYSGKRRGLIKFLLFPSTIEIKGQRVLVVDTIEDSGKTLKLIKEKLYKKGAEEVSCAVLVSKKDNFTTEADYRGVFVSKEKFLVGYGLDWKGYFRELSSIYAYEESVRKAKRA